MLEHTVRKNEIESLVRHLQVANLDNRWDETQSHLIDQVVVFEPKLGDFQRFGIDIGRGDGTTLGFLRQCHNGAASAAAEVEDLQATEVGEGKYLWNQPPAEREDAPSHVIVYPSSVVTKALGSRMHALHAAEHFLAIRNRMLWFLLGAHGIMQVWVGHVSSHFRHPSTHFAMMQDPARDK